jgi:hypothetical protein
MESLVGLGSFGALVTWLACAVIGGMAGQRKGAGLVGTLLGLILGPLGAAFAIAMVGSRGECMYCRELVRYEARKCPHCQSTLKADPPASAAPQVPAAAPPHADA